MAGEGRPGLSGEQDLARLLAGLEPRLAEARYAFTVIAEGRISDADSEEVFALIREPEGVTRIGTATDGAWARISLTIHSSLSAVGLTAVLSSALARDGISANVVAGYHHDHFFVPWDRRDDALAVLRGLSGEAA